LTIDGADKFPCKVDELIQQVELKNRQARSILHANPDEDMVLMAEDMAADADHILLEAMALNVTN